MAGQLKRDGGASAATGGHGASRSRSPRSRLPHPSSGQDMFRLGQNGLGVHGKVGRDALCPAAQSTFTSRRMFSALPVLIRESGIAAGAAGREEHVAGRAERGKE